MTVTVSQVKQVNLTINVISSNGFTSIQPVHCKARTCQSTYDPFREKRHKGRTSRFFISFSDYARTAEKLLILLKDKRKNATRERERHRKYDENMRSRDFQI